MLVLSIPVLHRRFLTISTDNFELSSCNFSRSSTQITWFWLLVAYNDALIFQEVQPEAYALQIGFEYLILDIRGSCERI